MNRARNTKISKFRAGCRLPHECSSVGDDYAANGPVKTYKLSPEELAKYGPVNKTKKNNRPQLTLETLIKELKKRTVGEVASKYCTTQKIVFEMVKYYGLELDEKNRLKGDDKVASIMEYARQVLPKEVLGPLLAEGKTNKEIGKMYNLPHWAVSELKKQYWGGNFNPDDYLAETETVEQEKPEESKVQNIDFDFENFELIIPKRFTGNDKKVLSVKNNYVSLSAAATKALHPNKFVMIKAKDGVLALIPTDDSRVGYSISQKRKCAQIGGNHLLRSLEKHRFGPGEYELKEIGEGVLVTSVKQIQKVESQ